ncbi:hypothetical protein NDA00_25590 [Funiculus sociatus GB2-M2]|uniref:hypothetical protein n=1 Tax=Trichocoleus sp. FACHB-90 TaxID=2692876 RepID=UPI001F54DD8E|nr:hypothetical protein [Trichocoleus sp. FACHB-90]
MDKFGGAIALQMLAIIELYLSYRKRDRPEMAEAVRIASRGCCVSLRQPNLQDRRSHCLTLLNAPPLVSVSVTFPQNKRRSTFRITILYADTLTCESLQGTLRCQ